jgi:circadian clock protein KaiC
MLVRLIDLFKTQAVTSFFTSLTLGGEDETKSDTAISSLMDTWLLLRDAESDGERRGTISVLKSRGMPHSKKAWGFRLSDHGIELSEPPTPRNTGEKK